MTRASPFLTGSAARFATHDTGQPFVEHLGSGAGFFNLIRIYARGVGVGVAVMGNATSYPIDAVARLALTD